LRLTAIGAAHWPFVQLAGRNRPLAARNLAPTRVLN